MNYLADDIPFLGPPLSEGPLPAFIYFALTAEESLTLDPFDTPIKELSSIRCFSLTIPFHGPEYDPKDMPRHLLEALQRGDDPITPFIDRCIEAVALIKPHSTSIAAGGVSRGAFTALHLAARAPEVTSVLAFAPVINLAFLDGYDPGDPLVQSLSPPSFLDDLVGKSIRIYIGNHDERVGTRETFDFMEKLVLRTREQGHRHAPVELFITHSIGHKGHGTSTRSFKEGAQWILDQSKHQTEKKL